MQLDWTQYTPDQLVKAYINLRTDVEVLEAACEAKIKPVKDLMDMIENEMLARSQREKTSSYATESGTAYQSRIKTVKVKNRQAWFAWLRTMPAEVQETVLTSAVAKEGVLEYMASTAVEVDGKKVETAPPGVEVGGLVKMNFRAK